MQQLMILRHAKAVPWSSSSEDFSRALREVGRVHARKVAEWMVDRLELPQAILCSPSQRTRETLAPLLALEPTLEPITRFVPQIYHSQVTTLHTLLDVAFGEVERVLIVGHNPGFEELVEEVIHSRHHDDFDRLPTGTLAVVDFSPDWSSGQREGTLRHLVRGKHLPGK